MTNTGASKLGFRILDALTDAFPSVVPKLFQRYFIKLIGSRIVFEWFQNRYKRQALGLTNPERILVIPDINIGDSVLLQAGVKGIQQAFPYAEVHYLCNATGGELFKSMPNVKVHNFLRGSEGMPTADDYRNLREVIERNSFSMIINFCAFFRKREFKKCGVLTLHLFVPHASYIIRSLNAGFAQHVSQLTIQFLHDFFAVGSANHSAPADVTEENVTYLTLDGIRIAQNILISHGLLSARGLVFLNPDATSKYGQMPFDFQRQLVHQLIRSPNVTALVIGSAYSDAGIENRLLESVSDVNLRQKIVIVNHIPIDAYGAVIDACDVFIAGDGGPLHFAATRKLDEHGRGLRNRTAIVTVHGATDSRLYGYDSQLPNHTRANQDVPSKVFAAQPPCRNITCINKWGKFCNTVRCFDGLEPSTVADYVISYLQHPDDFTHASFIEEPFSSNDYLPIQIDIPHSVEAPHVVA
jgi:ADP-heptose:LPS heptosyltransferase